MKHPICDRRDRPHLLYPSLCSRLELTPSLYLPTPPTDPATLPHPIHLTPPVGDRELLRAIIISNPNWASEVILSLNHHHIADATHWSDPIPTNHPALIMRIITCQRKRRRAQ